MSVLAHLERLDHRFAGSPETEYVYESRKFRLRLGVIALLTFVSLIIAVASSVPAVGWLLVLFALATGVKNYLALRQFRATVTVTTGGRWYER